MRNIFKHFYKKQAGFTLIEIMASMVITGIISLSVSMATAQVMNQTSRNSDYTSASHNTLNALHWMTRDIMMAQTINGTAGFPLNNNLTLQWRGWDNTVFSADYTVVNGELRRIYSGGAGAITTVIAENINPAAGLTYCISGNGTLTVSITASAGAGAKTVNVTKVTKIDCRPKL
jgi:prepilin-type N-terminal cleavage/methylation domain-containing protein